MIQIDFRFKWTRPGLAVTGLPFSPSPPPYNVVVALGQGTRPLSAVNAALMQVSLAQMGFPDPMLQPWELRAFHSGQ